MGGNIVKLIFSCISTGSGWDKLRNSANDALKNMGQLRGALKAVALQAGTVGGAIGRTLSAFAMGSIWGVAAEGAKLLIDKLGLFKDKTKETKEKLDKLEESTRKFYETINANSQKSLEKIDKETKRRNDQLDITNRMIKAELQLQKARAIAAGDTSGVERIDRQITEQDQKTAIQKAGFEVDSSAKRRDEAEAKMAATIAAEAKAAKELSDAEAALAFKSKPVETVMQSSAGAFVQTQTRDTTAEKAAVEAAKKRLELAKQQTIAAKEAYGIERDKYELAVDNVKALKAEQEAANETELAKRTAEAIKAEKERVAKEAAEEKKRLKDEEDAEKEIRKKQQAEKLRELEEYWRKEKERSKKALQDDIEANRKRADDLGRRLEDATARANAAHDVLGNAANMDQAGGVSEKRREWMNNSRFANGAADLMKSGKIRRGANGEWVANGRLSNMNQAILERLNADQNKQNLEKENDKVVKKLDELKKAIEQMSTL